MADPPVLDDQPDRQHATGEVEDHTTSAVQQGPSEAASGSIGTEEGKSKMAQSGQEEQKRVQEIEEGVRRPDSKEDWDRFIVA